MKAKQSPSALITNEGRTVLLRLNGHVHAVPQHELRECLGIKSKRKGLGITIEGNRFTFEFAGEEEPVVLTAKQLSQRLGLGFQKLIEKRRKERGISWADAKTQLGLE